MLDVGPNPWGWIRYKVNGCPLPRFGGGAPAPRPPEWHRHPQYLAVAAPRPPVVGKDVAPPPLHHAHIARPRQRGSGLPVKTPRSFSGSSLLGPRESEEGRTRVLGRGERTASGDIRALGRLGCLLSRVVSAVPSPAGASYPPMLLAALRQSAASQPPQF